MYISQQNSLPGALVQGKVEPRGVLDGRLFHPVFRPMYVAIQLTRFGLPTSQFRTVNDVHHMFT